MMTADIRLQKQRKIKGRTLIATAPGSTIEFMVKLENFVMQKYEFAGFCWGAEDCALLFG